MKRNTITLFIGLVLCALFTSSMMPNEHEQQSFSIAEKMLKRAPIRYLPVEDSPS